MQTLPLPTLNASKAVTPKASSALAVSTSNDAFKQALNQQVEQRQTLKNNAEAKAAERQAASRAAAPKPAQNARPAQPHNLDSTDKSAQPKPAQDQAAAPDNSTQAATPNPPAANDGDRASSDADAARTADPVADMLALMAAHNQPGAADGADAAVADPALAGTGQNPAGSAVDAATLATLTTLTAAEADAAAKADATDISEPTARFNGAEFKAALGRAAADALPVQNAVAAKAAAPDSKLTSLGAELASQHGAASAAGDVTAADTTVRPDAKADIANFGQQLNATRERQADALNGVRTDAKAEAEAALAAKDVAPAVTAAATAAAAPEVAKAVAPATTLYSRVGTPAWDQQLGQKVVFMAAGGEHSATMELNPPDLGPLQVVLSVNKDQATAAFTSAAPEVRQALEAALPRLREMMGEAGIQLGNATVSAGTSDQNPSNQAASSGSGQRGAPGNSGQGGLGGVDGAEAPRTTTIRRLPSGAVDTFA
jgi:flagellar hook-length control protein FliK